MRLLLIWTVVALSYTCIGVPLRPSRIVNGIDALEGLNETDHNRWVILNV